MNKRVFGLVLFLATATASAGPIVSLTAEPEAFESEVARFQVVQVVTGLEHPWALAFLPDGRVLITERPGKLWVLDDDVIREVSGVPAVRAVGQGGLLDVIAHPRFTDNQVIYLSYSASYGEGFGTRVARAKLVDESLRDLQVLFEMQPPGNGPVHFGSRFAFDADGYLFVTLGERGDRDLSQRLDAHHGKVIRLHDDGRVPADNPFIGKDGAHPEIYSFGHRNPQGLVFDATSGLLWLHEHGPRGGDALHIVRAGLNYGWPLATYGREYHGPRIGTTPDQHDDIVQPVIHWTPSIAPCGLTQMRGGNFPAWEGNLFAGALIQQHIRRIVIEGETVVHQEELLRDRFGRIREVVMGRDGNLWFATDAPDGGVYRIEPVE